MPNIKITQIKANPKNPRVIKDERFKKLCKSLEDFPEMLEKRPLVCFTDSDGKLVVLGGNMRLKAAKEIGLKELPVMLADDWTEEQKQQFLIKDNVGFGEWNWDELQADWDMQQLEEWGLELPDFAQTELEAVEDDYEIPDEVQTDIVLGDLFEIGPHRLLCGDSTDSDAVARLMNGKKAELLFTSPPYSDMREYNGEKDLSVENLAEFIPTWMPFVEYQVVNLGIQRKDNEIVQYWDEYIEKAKQCGYKLISWNVWNREQSGTMAQQTAMFAILHEWIFVFGHDAKKLNRTIPNKHTEGGKRKQKKVRQADGTHEKTTAMFYDSKQLGTVTTCLYETGTIRKLHPATFPIELPSEYIKAMTNEKQVVAESFTGSGSTMVAAHQLNRKCYGMELDPKYCQVIIDRMLKLDPSLEIKKNGIKYNQNAES